MNKDIILQPLLDLLNIDIKYHKDELLSPLYNNDNLICSLSTLLDLGTDVIYSKLHSISTDISFGSIHDITVLDALLNYQNYTLYNFDNNSTKISIGSFMYQNPKGRFFIISEYNQIFCYVNGNIYINKSEIISITDIGTHISYLYYEKDITPKINIELNILKILGLKTCIQNLNPNGNGYYNDCSIRSLAKALNTTWEEVFDSLHPYCIKHHMMPNDIRIITKYLSKNNFKMIRKIRDIKISVAEFMYQNREGTFIISAGDHMICYKDGVWYDNKNNLYNNDEFICRNISWLYCPRDYKICFK